MFHFNFCNFKYSVCKTYTYSVFTLHCVVYSVCPLCHVMNYRTVIITATVSEAGMKISSKNLDTANRAAATTYIPYTNTAKDLGISM